MTKKIKKIYIVGAVGSGKTTFAKELSNVSKINYYSLDTIFYKKSEDSPWGTQQRDLTECKNQFKKIMKKDSWIIEDVCRGVFTEGLRQADLIIFLDTSTFIRNWRIIFRFFKQLFGFESVQYKPSYKILRKLLEYSKNFDSGEDNLRERLEKFSKKMKIVKNHSQKKILLLKMTKK